MNYIGINGTLVPAAQAMVSVMDHGFLYGMGLFETFRTYSGVPFLFKEHLDRLRDGCRTVGIRAELDEAGIMALIRELMAANGLQDAYIRYTLTAGEAPFGLPSEPYGHPAEVVYVRPLPQPAADLYTRGKALYVLSTPRNTPETPVRLKSLHYMNNIMAKQELMELERRFGSQANPEGLASEGLLLTRDGELAEGIVSNLFIVSEGQLHTPSIDRGILPGITRSKVIELAKAAGVKVIQGRFGRELLTSADEIFLTSSIQELTPVTKVIRPNGSFFVIGSGTAGPLTLKLLHSYRNLTGGYSK
ncbi:aminotransferase class IV [Paenibacillus pinistramenti]|uniref:aminotransferase class IV n=1 Tax=Paenibacillus pinistramenti TaxID=1768003 RepID=UPI0011088CE2|nr:aminotransferase class IV [Paenibacillus pinistramenti]